MKPAILLSFAASTVIFAECMASRPACAQAITVDTRTGSATTGSESSVPIDRRYQQIKPTQVELPAQPLGGLGRSTLLRTLQAEHGFAMRPLPRGHKGLKLEANGLLEPAGEGYLQMVADNGVSAKPGDRVIITDIKIERDKIVLDLNGGPDPKHRFLRHLQIGVGSSTSPISRDEDQAPTGSRLTLSFPKGVPDLSGAQAKALLVPMISFDQKTPIEAFTDTLPAPLKQAILDHRVLVGMSTEMVAFAKGRPESKSREMEGQMPFEEWIYGKPPQPVEFIRINGNRVIRVAIAKVGEKPMVYTEDLVSPMMQGREKPAAEKSAAVRLGDTERSSETQAPAPPPSLSRPGEPASEMRPVRFPEPQPPQTTQPAERTDEDASPH